MALGQTHHCKDFALGNPNSWRAGSMLMFLSSAQPWTPAPLLPVRSVGLLNMPHMFVESGVSLRRARKELYLTSSSYMLDTLRNDLMSSYGNSEKLPPVYRGEWSSGKWSNLSETTHILSKWHIINLNTLAPKTSVNCTVPHYLLIWTSLFKVLVVLLYILFISAYRPLGKALIGRGSSASAQNACCFWAGALKYGT